MNISSFRKELVKLGFEYFDKSYTLNLNGKSIEVYIAHAEFCVYINKIVVYLEYYGPDLTNFLSAILNIIRSIKIKAILNG
jgi:hypothetical protein